ncbi:uncharacterized protein LOC129939025 [Eupeodes corollae]|uniref:uncharacterized protein LOC129939025 n=1 Tax=Eupeodes corollae TaxID=290404 RepID=UPI002493AD4E|nr:uncharacterized protein LOC129939025 [Eupeodes corollae]
MESSEASPPPPPKDEPNYFKKLWAYRKYINMEPFMFFYLMPSVFNAVAVQNFPLEKACRVNYNYSEIVCQAILDKEEFGIDDCEGFNFENMEVGSGLLWNVTNLSPNFNYTVCKAERDAQKLSAHVSGIRAPIAAIFPLIVILFAGGWSDRYNKRKPCIMFPLVGEGLQFLGLFISAIFFDVFPMEFGAYIEAIVPSMFGGFNFVLMAVYGYITSATPEADRIFRFGIFSMFLNFIPFVGLPFSGILFLKLGYVYSFAMSWIFQLIAFFYVLFFIDEIPVTDEKEKPIELGTTNTAFEVTDVTEVNGNREAISALDAAISTGQEPPPKKSCLAEFFDPTLAIECIKMPFEKRTNYGQALFILIMIAYFLTSGPASGEVDYWYRYILIKLNWNGNQFSAYSTFSSASTIIGTFIGTAIFSKFMKISDPMIGILSALCIVISRVMYAFAKDSLMYYSAGLVEMFVTLRIIAIKAIGSSIVEGDELGRMYAIFGVTDPIGTFVIPPLYSYVYENTVDTFPGAIFLLSEVFYVPNVIVFIICYILLKKRKNKGEKIDVGSTRPSADADKIKDKVDENVESQTEITSL